MVRARKRRNETEKNQSSSVLEMKIYRGEAARGRPKLRWKDTVRRDMEAWKIREERATDRQMEMSLQNPLPCTGNGGQR